MSISNRCAEALHVHWTGHRPPIRVDLKWMKFAAEEERALFAHCLHTDVIVLLQSCGIFCGGLAAGCIVQSNCNTMSITPLW